jgi:heme oxygenase
MTVLAAIRAATRLRHENLETSSRIVERLLSPSGRRQVLSALYGLHREAERVLLPWLAPLADLQYQQRLKLPCLALDLKALGLGSGDIPMGSSAPRLASTAEAVGFAYVLEGATLGGRVIAKRLSKAGVMHAGASFFDVYGSAAGAQWKVFCHVLEREGSTNPAAAVRGACAGFDFMRQGLMLPVEEDGVGDCEPIAERAA